MGKTMLDQLATNQALYEASRGGRRMGNVSAGRALLSAAMIERQKANADGYSYSGGSYGSFVGSKNATEAALESAMMIQSGSIFTDAASKKSAAQYISRSTSYSVPRSGSYSYAGGSYGSFIEPEEEALHVAQVIDGGVGAGTGEEHAAEQPTDTPKGTQEKGIIAFLKKYKLWVIAAVCVVLYFVLRKE